MAFVKQTIAFVVTLALTFGAQSRLSVASAPLQRQPVTWFPCPRISFATDTQDDGTIKGSAVQAPSQAECAMMRVPLCHDGVCEDPTKQEIEIFVKRLTTNATGQPNVLFIAGGPGQSSTSMEPDMTSLYQLLNGNVNVYTVEHRGTGRSSKLDCAASEALLSGSPGGIDVTPEEVGACAMEVEAQYGRDLSSFSITSAAWDLHALITDVVNPEEAKRTFVYGVSYGSALVERLMHLNTSGIAGYILDGISTTSGSDVENFMYFSKWDLGSADVGEQFMAYCDKDQEHCGQYFKHQSLSETLRSLVIKLDEPTSQCGPAIVIVYSYLFSVSSTQAPPPSEALRELFGNLLQDRLGRKLIPILTYRLTRCSQDDEVALGAIVKWAKAQMEFREDTWLASSLLKWLITFAEMWEIPTPTLDEMIARTTNGSMGLGMYQIVRRYCAFTKDPSPSCAEFHDKMTYNASALTYQRDQYWNVAAAPPADVSVLLMSGKLDPQTPHKNAEYLYKALQTQNKELVTFDYSTHGTVRNTADSDWDDGHSVTCGMKILASYVQSGGNLRDLDKSCLRNWSSLDFNVDRLMQLVHISSAYDGVYTGPVGGTAGSGSLQTPFGSQSHTGSTLGSPADAGSVI